MITNILGISCRQLFIPFILGGNFGGRLVVDYARGEIELFVIADRGYLTYFSRSMLFPVSTNLCWNLIFPHFVGLRFL